MTKKRGESGPNALRKIAEAEQRKKDEAAAAARKVKDQQIASLSKEMVPRLYRKCRTEARKAAKAGERSALVTVLQWEQHRDSVAYLAASRAMDAVVAQLRKKEFTVEQKSEDLVPFGSDPLFPYTVYSLYITITF
jgi:sRNA-binding protein